MGALFSTGRPAPPPGAVVVEIESDERGGRSSPTVPEPAAAAAEPAAPTLERSMRIDGKVLATPAVRRLAREHTLNLEHVLGTGKDGRVLKSDVLQYVASLSPAVAAAPAAAAPVAPVAPPAGEDVVVPVRGIQRMMAKSMSADLKAKGIPVVAVAPGFVVTEFGPGAELMAKFGGAPVDQAGRGIISVLDSLDMEGTGRFMVVPSSGEAPRPMDW